MTGPDIAGVAPAVGDRVTYADDVELPPDPVGIVVEPGSDEADPTLDTNGVLVDWPEPHGRTWEVPGRVRVLAPTARWWIGWYSAGTFKYLGPWWVTGNEVAGRRRSTFCAAVQADSEVAARQVIADAHSDPAAWIEWRWTEQQADDWSPFGGPYPRAGWMRWSR